MYVIRCKGKIVTIQKKIKNLFHYHIRVYFYGFILICCMKKLYLSTFSLLFFCNLIAQPAKKFGYELKIVAKSPSANGNFYPGDEFKLIITPVNPELWDGKKRYFS